MKRTIAVKQEQEQTCVENFLYGKRLKATLTTYIKNRNKYKVTLYKSKNEIHTTKLFFNNNLAEDDFAGQLDLYKKAHAYATNWLNTCKY